MSLNPVEQLLAKDAIKELKYRHLRLLDCKRWDALADTFCADVRTRYANGEFAFEGRDAVMDFLRTSPLGTDNVCHAHHVGAGEITLTDSQHAQGVWRLFNPMLFVEEGMNYQLLAFYCDEYRCENGVWKISATGHQYLLETQSMAAAMSQNASFKASYPMSW